MIYIACPFRHPNHKVRIERVETANRYAYRILRSGHPCFSPLSHSYPIEMMGNEWPPDGYDMIPDEMWMRVDISILQHCEQVHVLMIDGWKESVGVGKEIAFAISRGIPILYVEKSNI